MWNARSRENGRNRSEAARCKPWCWEISLRKMRVDSTAETSLTCISDVVGCQLELRQN
jgi:hypothetical protein